MELHLADNERLVSGHSNRSILSAMKGFIDAVNDMDETVLIPSRLMDMQLEPSILALHQQLPTPTDTPTTTTGHDLAVYCTQDSISLHACYAMLKAVKSELIRGTVSEDQRLSPEDDVDFDEENGGAGKTNRSLEEATARAFREHLLGLFTVLQQLTNVSKKLTTKYQEELGDFQSCFKPKAPASFLK